jgi:hypothetical protein
MNTAMAMAPAIIPRFPKRGEEVSLSFGESFPFTGIVPFPSCKKRIGRGWL